MRIEVYGFMIGTFHHDVTSIPGSGFGESKSDANELSKIMRLSRAMREELNSFWRSWGILAVNAHGGAPSSAPLGVTGTLLETLLQAPNLRLTFGMESFENMALGKGSCLSRCLTASLYGFTLLADLILLVQHLKNQRRCQIILYVDEIATDMRLNKAWGLSAFVGIFRRLSGYQQVTVHFRYRWINRLLGRVKPRCVQSLCDASGTEDDYEDIEALAKQMLEQTICRGKHIDEDLNAELESCFGPAIAETHQRVESDLEIMLSFRPQQLNTSNI